jgi:hypothetical protein
VPFGETGAVNIVIRGHHLPGRDFRYAAVPIHNVHVAVQVGDAPEGLVRADAKTAEWTVDVRVEVDDEGGFDFGGPAVHGRRGERFLYLTWGELGEDRSFTMFRRAKLVLGDVDTTLVAEARRDGRALVATVDLTDEHGGPRCARVGPPALTWS